MGEVLDGREKTHDTIGASDLARTHRLVDVLEAEAVALVLLAVLVGGGLYLVYRLRASADMQDCVMQGRSNCAAVDPR